MIDQGPTGLYGLYQQVQTQILGVSYANVFWWQRCSPPRWWYSR